MYICVHADIIYSVLYIHHIVIHMYTYIHRAQEGDYSLIHELMEVTFIHHLPHIYPLSFPPYFFLISLLFSLIFSALFPPYFRCCLSHMMNRVRKRRTSGIKRLHFGPEVRGGGGVYVWSICLCVWCVYNVYLYDNIFLHVYGVCIMLATSSMYVIRFVYLFIYICSNLDMPGCSFMSCSS